MKLETTLQTLMDGRNNNFNLLRMIGALVIMLAHAMFITLGDDINFETYPVRYTLGITTLNLFFILSGMLVTTSWLKRGDVVSYCCSRFMRIIPGLVVVSFFVPFILGPMMTTLTVGDYFSQLSTWIYWPLTSMLNPDMTLPGVFHGLPNDGEVNAPLWTLRYEAFFYGCLVLAGFVGVFKVRSVFVFFAGLLFAIYLIVSFSTDLREMAAIDHLMHFGYSFLIGACCYIYRDKIPIDFKLSLFLLLVALGVVYQFGLTVGEVLLIPAAALLGLWIAFVPGGWLRGYNLVGDYSYGLYIWHYPIEQSVRYRLGDMEPSSLFFISLPFALGAAVLSWHFVERPALQNIGAVTAFIKSRLMFVKQH